MAETKERRKTPRKTTSKPDSQPETKAAAPRKRTSEQGLGMGNVRAEMSPEETRQRIAEAAYYRAKQRGFEPGRELEDWIEAESEIMGRINGSAD
jgi:hypothetical protein